MHQTAAILFSTHQFCYYIGRLHLGGHTDLDEGPHTG